MLIEIIGWTGSIVILAGYALLSSGRIAARSIAYQLMNIFGALGLAINGWFHWALPSVCNNLIWAAIGGVAMIRILRRPALNEPS
jgi:hypothetical protein